MQELDDNALLREYVECGSDEAFAALVVRHVNKVYSVALRHTGNPHQAEEITQAVFIILARKSRHLGQRVILSGWLYQTARLTAMTFIRSEIRRACREQEAQMQTANESDLWTQIAPLLDAAMAGLNETDRQAVVLRFFDGKTMSEVGTALGASEDGAEKRVSRALEKLRKYFSKRGVTSTTETLAGTISANSVQTAPVLLAKTATAVALAKGTTASISTLTLIKGALKIMAWSKTQTVIIAGVIVLLAATATTAIVKDVQYHKYAREYYTWEVPEANFSAFYNALPQISILPTKFTAETNGGRGTDGSRGTMGIDQPIKQMVEAAYQQDDLHTVVISDLPTNRYDFLAKLVGPLIPHHNLPVNEKWAEEFQKAIAKKLGITGRFEMRNADVLVLRPVQTGTHGFKVSHSMPGGMAIKPILQTVGSNFKVGYEYHEQPVNDLIGQIQNKVHQPVVDETGLTNSYDFSFTWTQNSGEPNLELPDTDVLEPLLTSQLGLELVPTNIAIEMLVVEKAN